MRIMGVDFGDARVGLSLCDPTETLAGGIGFVKVSGIGSAVKAVSQKVSEHRAELIVCGLPINMNGTQGEKVQRVKIFAERLSEETGVKVEFIDERLTTVMAHSFMNQTGTHGKKRKESVDTLSAQIILQTYLDRRKN